MKLIHFFADPTTPENIHDWWSQATITEEETFSKTRFPPVRMFL